MGIGPHAIKLTEIVSKNRLLKHGFSVMELGSQDFAPTMAAADSAVRNAFGFSVLGSNSNGHALPSAMYEKLGASSYDCIDLDGNYGAHVFDLNYNLTEKYGFDKQFDFVTNHGTTEHLFNQMTAFENVHRLTAIDGVMLHALPFQGYQNHGLFSYSPSMFLDMALVNEYEIVGLFLSLQDKLFAYDEDFLLRNRIASSEDVLVMAVLIKRTDAPFVAPYDGRYFSRHGRDTIAPLDRVGSTRRFGGKTFSFEGLDDETTLKSSLASPPRAVKAQPKYRFITPVWGMSYVHAYLDVTLPSQLSPGNLGAFSREETVYTVVTSAAEMQVLQASPLFGEVAKFAQVEFVLHEPLPDEHSYVRMTRCYNLALENVSQRQGCFFLTADDFYSSNLFGTAKASIDSGKRAVMVPTIRVVAESFETELAAMGVTTVDGRKLVSLMMRHEHPMTTACVVNDSLRTVHPQPCQTLYRTQNGYIGRWNVMHPLAVVVKSHPSKIRSTVDWNYAPLHLSGMQDVHVIRDSDEGAIASLTEFSYSQNEEYRSNAGLRDRIRSMRDWVNTNWPLNFHIKLIEEPVYFHTGNFPADEKKTGLSQIDSVWNPFNHYVKVRRVPVADSVGEGPLFLLMPAVRTSRLSRFYRRARYVRRRILLQAKSRVYSALVRRFR